MGKNPTDAKNKSKVKEVPNVLHIEYYKKESGSWGMKTFFIREQIQEFKVK